MTERSRAIFMNIRLLLNSLLLVLWLTGCTRTLLDKADEVDDAGRASAVRITYPADNTTAVATGITVTGSAYDRGGIEKVEIRLNGGDYASAEGTVSFSLPLQLSIGENVITARMINSKAQVFTSDPVYVYALWKKTAELPYPYSHSTAVYNGTDFMVLGGWISDWSAVPSLDTLVQYAPAANTVTVLNPLHNTASMIHAYAYQNKIYAQFGFYFKSRNIIRNTLDIYDLSGNLLSSESGISYVYARAAAAYALHGSKVYFIGGINAAQQKTATIIEYDIAFNTYAVVSVIDKNLAYASAVSDGSSVWVFGGVDDGGLYSNAVYRYIPAANTLVKLSDRLNYKRAGASAVIIGSKVYLLGGQGYSLLNEPAVSYLNAVEVFNLATESGIELRRMPQSLSCFGAATDGTKILIFGGLNAEGFFTKSAIYEYYPQYDSLNY